MNPICLRSACVALLLIVAGTHPIRAADWQVVFASGQRGLVGTTEIEKIGGQWDRAGRLVLEGAYKPSPGGVPISRSFVWTLTPGGPASEILADGSSAPYFSSGIIGDLPKISAPRTQALFSSYRAPADFRIIVSGLQGVPPVYERSAIWVDDLALPTGISPTVFIVNELETYIDGPAKFLRPNLLSAIVRTRASTAGIDPDTVITRPSGGGVQIYVNMLAFDDRIGRGGTIVWRSKSNPLLVVSGRSNVVSAIAASSGVQTGLPGSGYGFIQVLGVDPQERLLWEASRSGSGTTELLRGEAGSWTTLLKPGTPAPPARGAAPSAATPLDKVGTVGLVEDGAAVFAETVYGGDLTNRAALQLVTGDVPKLFALEGEIVDGTVPGVRLGRFTPTGYSWPNSSLTAFYASVRGGEFAFLENQGLVLANEAGLWLLARQDETLPVPAGGARVRQFLFPVVAARADGSVVFGAQIIFPDGATREVLYLATPGLPNRYEVLLESGTSFTVSTPSGPATATVRHMNLASWRPGFTDQLMLNVDLQNEGTSAVLLMGATPVPAAVIRAELFGPMVRLSWPTILGALLESSSVVGSAEWLPVGVVPSERDGVYEATIPMSEVQRYFRIRPAGF